MALAVLLAAALAGCGGGGGDPPGSGTLLTGASVNAPGPTSATLVAEPAARVNPAGPGRRSLLAVGGLAHGGHAVAWLSEVAGSASVRLRQFDPHGQPIGAELAVGVDTLQGEPAAAVLADGGMAVAAVEAAPLSVDEPWVTRSTIRVQRLAASGQVLADVDVGEVLQNRIGAVAMRYVTDPAVVRWDDGSFLVAWAFIEEDANGRRPQFWAQRFDAAGSPAGAESMLAEGEPGQAFTVAAAPSGGWVLATSHQVIGRPLVRYTAFGGAAVPAPPGAAGHAEGTHLVPLYGGGVALLSPAKVYGSVQAYGADGRATGTATALPLPPVGGVALHDGGFVAFHAGAAGLVAQRFDASGQPVGHAAAVSATAAVQGAPLAGGGLVIGWTAAGAAGGDADVMAQRLR